MFDGVWPGQNVVKIVKIWLKMAILANIAKITIFSQFLTILTTFWPVQTPSNTLRGEFHLKSTQNNFIYPQKVSEQVPDVPGTGENTIPKNPYHAGGVS